MSFDRPYAFLLLLIPLVSEILRRRPAASVPRYALDIWGHEPGIGTHALTRAIAVIRNFFMVSGLILLSVAAAGPARVERSTVFMARGADVIFALDVSPSMGAKDLFPDRFHAAFKVIESFISQSRNEAVGIVAFASDAMLACPPTTDYGALRDSLANVNPGTLGEGTALGTGMAVAIRHVLSSPGKEKRVVVLTDGENNSGALSPETAVALAARHGVIVTVIGVGSSGEVPIEYLDPSSGTVMGGTYHSSFDEEALRNLAVSTGGEYLSAVDDKGIERALSALSTAIPAMVRKHTHARRVPEGFAWLQGACLFLALSWLLNRLFLGGLP